MMCGIPSTTMMLSPNPFSLLLAILLCLPLTLLFTTTPILHHPPPPPPLLQPPPQTTPSPPPPIPPEPQPTVLPPPTPQLPPDDHQDLALFRRAARTSPTATAPRKLAFLFLTTTPLPFAPLWHRFFNTSPSPHLFNIYIHADPSLPYRPPFSGFFSHRVIPHSKPTHRHSPTLATAARRLLSHALLHDPSNHAFALLSAACIPLHSFPFTYTHLTHSSTTFIEILANETGAYDRWAARGDHAMLPELPFKDFRIGSQFWVLTRRHARKVARDTKLWKKFRQPCVRLDTCYPEENYFPTLMSTVGARNVVPATLTHVDWSGRFDGHPRLYNASEINEDLIRRLRSERLRYGDRSDGSDWAATGAGGKVPFLFARKFAPNCVGPLLNISDDVIFRD